MLFQIMMFTYIQAEEYASDAHNFKDQMEKFGGCIDELQQSMERIHYYVNGIMDGFDKQKEEVVKNSRIYDKDR